MINKMELWLCWTNEAEHIVSFHEVEGWQMQHFRCREAFWLYIQAKTTDGFLVQ